MIRMSAICMAVLVSGAVLSAQQAPRAGDSGQPPTAQIVLPQPSRCPIGMRAQQGSSTQMLRANDGTFQHVMTPSLTLTTRDNRSIIGAVVTARGYAGGGVQWDLTAHLVDPDNPQHKREEVVKILTLKLSAGGLEPNTFSAELQLAGFNVLNSIQLGSVTFSDGSTWKMAANSGCLVTPDPLMLIANQ